MNSTTDTQNAEELLVQNANRLLADAELLLSQDRLPTAFSLAVMAIQECDKLYRIRWSDKLAKEISAWDELHDKDRKTRSEARYIIDAGRKFLDELDAKHNLSALTLDEKIEIFTDPDYENAYHHYLMTFTNVALYEPEESQGRMTKKLFRGDPDAAYSIAGTLGRLELAGIYVRINKKGYVLNNPGDIDRKLAERYIAFARISVGCAKDDISK